MYHLNTNVTKELQLRLTVCPGAHSRFDGSNAVYKSKGKFFLLFFVVFLKLQGIRFSQGQPQINLFHCVLLFMQGAMSTMGHAGWMVNSFTRAREREKLKQRIDCPCGRR